MPFFNKFGGGSGVVVIRYLSQFAPLTSVAAGLTSTFTETGGYKIYRFTAGTGSIVV